MKGRLKGVPLSLLEISAFLSRAADRVTGEDHTRYVCERMLTTMRNAARIREWQPRMDAPEHTLLWSVMTNDGERRCAGVRIRRSTEIQ